MAYGDFKDLIRSTVSDKILRYKAFNVAKNPKYDEYQKRLASMVYKFFDKKKSGGAIKNKIMSNKELVEKLHKPIIRKVEKSKVYSSFIENIWGTHLADMELISKFDKGFRFLFCIADMNDRHDWVIPLKDKKGITITSAFQKNLSESNGKLNRARVDFDKKNNKEDPKFRTGDHVRISKYKNTFAKAYVPNWS